MTTSANGILGALRAAVADPTQVRTRALDLHANAHDASHFLLIPQAVVVAGNADEVGQLLRASAAQGVPLTFRSGGTSLSGQALTDGVLVDVRRNFKGIEVLDNGARVRVQPGVTVRALNARLAPYGRKFGPDPASEGACTIGGVVANNSSGMACGTVNNTYKTLESLTVVLPSGTVVDTGAPDADERLRTLEPELHEGLLRLSRRVRGNPDSVATIQHQFSMKNTMGYGVNSLLDFERPADILAHLIVGSEGTLGFVADAVFRTIPRLAHVTTALLVFADLEAANTALPALVETGAATLELMDALSLKVGQTLPGTPPVILDLSVRDHAALLVEYHADSAERLAELHHVGAELVDRLPLSAPSAFSADSVARAQLWHLRKGLYAAVAGARRQGTTALLEDVVVPVPALGRTCIELIKLFDKYSYRNSVIFGHAKDGNIHFMLTDGFSAKDELDRYSAFTEDMVDVVLGEGGSLKAEHGTGRVMAPYVRRQYGDELYDVMREVKLLFDPAGMLNPGVLMDDDPKAHLRHIKTAPPVAEEVDRCVSCGYCEPVCPSRNITLTPRQRIVTLRAIEQAKLDGDHALAAELEKDYEYGSVDTCAVDGLCQTACPVDINTAHLVKRFRKRNAGPAINGVWGTAAKHWSVVTKGASLALTGVRKVPIGVITPPNKLGRMILGPDTLPLYSEELPGGGSVRKRPAPTGKPAAVYFPACVGTMFGPAVDSSPASRRASSSSANAPASRCSCRRGSTSCAAARRGPPRGSWPVRPPCIARRWRPCAPRPGTASCPSSATPRRARRAAAHDRDRPERQADDDHRLGRVRAHAHPAAPARPHQARVPGPAPHLLVDPDGHEREPEDRRPVRGRARGDLRERGLLRLRRRPRDAAPRAHRVRHPGAGGRRRRHGRHRARLLQPHLRAGHDPGHRRALPPRARAPGGAEQTTGCRQRRNGHQRVSHFLIRLT